MVLALAQPRLLAAPLQHQGVLQCRLRRAPAQTVRALRSDVSCSAGPTSSRTSSGGGSRTDLPTCFLGATAPSNTHLAASPGSAQQQEAAWLLSATAAGDGGDGGSGAGSGGSGGGGGGGEGGAGGSGEEDSEEELLSLKQAQELAAAKGVSLPEDMAAAAAAGGLRASVLAAYAAIAVGGGLPALLSRALPAFRDRLIVDRLFLFKILAEVCIDAGCATVAELRKRGDEFWGEFEFYLSDLLVGLVLDVVLVTLISPKAILGRAAQSATASGLQKYLGRLPSAVFQASTPGRKFGVLDRSATFVKLGLEYSLAGIICGFIGQGVANSLMLARRHYGGGASESDVKVPPLFRTSLVWGMFMGLSSNARYQMVFGLERLVDMTVARRVPQVAYLSTTIIRFINNVVGGEQFIDMARWAGVQ